MILLLAPLFVMGMLLVWVWWTVTAVFFWTLRHPIGGLMLLSLFCLMDWAWF